MWGPYIASHNYVVGYETAEQTVVQFSPARLPYNCHTESFLAGSVMLVVSLRLSILLSSLVEVRPLSDLSLCLLHESDSGQPFLCGPQSSGKRRQW